MPMFQPKPTQVCLGQVWSNPKNRHDKREEDHYLYFDLDGFQFTVVKEVEMVSGPNTSCSHDIQSVANYLAENPDHRGRVIDLLPQRLSNCAVHS